MDELLQGLLTSDLVSTRFKLKLLGFEEAHIDSLLSMSQAQYDDDADAGVTTTGGTNVWSHTGSITGGTIVNGNINTGTGLPTTTAPVGGYTFYGSTGGASHSSQNTAKSNISFQQNAVKTMTKSKLRYVIIKQDGSTLELREQPQITPREMIGLSKLFSLVSTYVGVVLGDVQGVYNVNISWSQLINELAIEKHFIDGLPKGSYNQDDEVLDIFLYDPPQ